MSKDTKLTPTLNSFPLEAVDPTLIFRDEQVLTELLSEVRATATAIEFDPELASGRKLGSSVAFKVRQCKTVIEKARKLEVADLIQAKKDIDGFGKIARDYLDNLAKEIKQPIEDYRAEQARIAEELEAEETRKAEAERLAEEIGTDWTAAIAEDERIDREIEMKARIAELEAANAEQTREVREKAERAEAEEKARVEAEEATQRAAAKAEQDEKDRIKAEKDIEDARLAGIEAERKRIEKVEREAEAERKAREADIENQKKVNNKAKDAFITGGLKPVDAIKAVTLVAGRKVPGITITY